ncbi:PP2C family protein-serine/threonine phosphatase [Amycolatopsis alkalitolerans]|uniref:Serine/threonine-protein phosphatase n=1 Tax=Amycolatopsis alkalitolerans TaxID=2547244 RepID=A0A5C4LRS4_9PSEU|nr:PP2C family protein-serine/threonine phosphatase [Amycolatopsis alkalitolerans]TNC19605.1 serine/threonine-protein phosphatase [Amycolatopsis alkalitolerans]
MSERVHGHGNVEQLREIIDRQQQELQMHRTELERTNAGLLALHAEVEGQRQRTAFLDEVSRTAAASLRRHEVARALVGLVEREGVATSAAVWLLDDSHRLRREPEPGEPGRGVRQVAATRRAVAGEKRILVPLTVGPDLLGVLELRRDEPVFGEEDLPFARAVAARSAVGLRNANEYERERELAGRLQLAMLPALDTPADLHLCARYLPAARGVNVGGDWFDAFTRPDGTVVLTVGDVTGHGLEAAVIMGKLQNALRAYAAEGHGPAETLRLTHNLLRGWHSPLLATAVVLDLELATGRIRWANAGHLPVFVADAEGAVRSLDEPNAPLMGVPFPFEISEYQAKLSPGETVLLYTDGLVERRREPIDTGMDRLARIFRRVVAASPEEAGDRILEEMLGAQDHDDDVCLLLCRWATAAPGVRSAESGTP